MADAPTPPSKPPNRAKAWWRRRSWKGKTLSIIGAVFVGLLIIGFAVPAPDESEGDNAEAAEATIPATTEQTTTDVTTAETTGETTDETPAEEPPSPALAVARVIDGDTIELDDGTRVRLVQIDSPELKGAECYATKAAAELRRMLPVGQKVSLEADPGLDQTDRYDRQLRYVRKGGVNVNVALVKRGAASVWFYQGDRGKYAEKLMASARQAKQAKRGLWGACAATALDPLHAVTTRKASPPKAASPAPSKNCHPSYKGACLDPSLSDYDCAGGSGDGPGYTGTVRVVGPDEYRLDSDGDGIACE